MLSFHPLYSEAEFWLSSGKVLLFFLFFFFTIVTMCGGNPTGWAYGFYYWQNPGAFKEYIGTGARGQLTGFLSGGLNSAIFTVVGPEYLSMVAGEIIYQDGAFTHLDRAAIMAEVTAAIGRFETAASADDAITALPIVELTRTGKI